MRAGKRYFRKTVFNSIHFINVNSGAELALQTGRSDTLRVPNVGEYVILGGTPFYVVQVQTIIPFGACCNSRFNVFLSEAGNE